MKINYVRTDSANRNFLYTDTIHFTYRPPKEKKSTSSKEKEKEEQIIRFLSLQHNIQSNHEIYQPIRLEFEQPIINFDSTHVKLFIEKDSVFEPVNYKIIKDTLNIRKYELRPRWEPEGKYRFLVDSAAFKSYYGLWNNKIDQNFSVKSLEQYGNLLIVMYGLPENKDVYVELLDKSDKPIRKTLVKKMRLNFRIYIREHIMPAYLSTKTEMVNGQQETTKKNDNLRKYITIQDIMRLELTPTTKNRGT